MESVKEVNLVELEEKYGADLVEEMKEHITYADENNHAYTIQVVNPGDFITEIAFITSAYAYIFQVSMKRKKIMSKDNIGWRACENIYKLMNQL